MHLSSTSLFLSLAFIFGWHCHVASPAAASRRAPEASIRDSNSFIVPISRHRIAEIDRKRMIADKFDPIYAKEELASLVFKYQNAPKFLKGLTTHAPHNASLVDGGQGRGQTTHRNASSSHAVNSPNFVVDDAWAEADTEATLKMPPILATSGEAKMLLTDMMAGSLDVLYYGPLRFGTPPQELTVDVDTGSADLWIPAGCPACSNKQFDKKSSSTYSESESTFDVTYGTGEVSAILATDVVAVQGLSIHNQSFGAVTQESDDFNTFPNSGLLGMAFSSIAASGEPTFFDNLIREKQLAAPMFSVHLERGEENGSEVCFGCVDDDKMLGTIHWIPVVSKTYWSVALEHVSVNSTAVTAAGVIAAIDTGTTLIYLPQDIATKLYSMVPGSKPAAEYGPAFFTVPCSGQFTMSFSFGGGHFAIDNRDFNLGPVDDDATDCIGGILGLGDDFPANLAIMGDEFLKSWYSTFDYSNGARVGFSASVNNKT